MRRSTPLVALSIAALVGISPLASRAEGVDGASLEVVRAEGAQGCPDAAGLAARVRELRAAPSGARPPAPGTLRLDVQMLREPGGFSAVVRASGPSPGVRTLRASGETCAPLAEALAVSLALLLDDAASPDRAAPAPSPALAPASSPASAPPPSPPDDSRSSSLSLRVGGGASLGLPSGWGSPIFAGVEASLGERLLFGLDAQASPTRSFDHPPGRVEVSLLLATGSTCARLAGSPRSARLIGCALAAFGWLSAEGRGYAPDRSAGRPLFAVGASAGARGPLAGEIGWAVDGRLLAPLSRETFSVDGVPGVAYDPPRAGGEALFSLTLRFW